MQIMLNSNFLVMICITVDHRNLGLYPGLINLDMRCLSFWPLTQPLVSLCASILFGKPYFKHFIGVSKWIKTSCQK